MLTAVANTAITEAIINIGAPIGDIADIANIAIYLQKNGSTQFSTSQQKEVIGLFKKGVFKIIKLYNIPKGVRLFNSQFVDEIKNKGTNKAFKKSRLVVQAYNNLEKELVLT